MKQPVCVGLAIAVALNSVLLAWGAPGSGLGNIRFGEKKIFDNDYEDVNSLIYNIITSVTTKKGKCFKHVTVTGNGVGDAFDLPCSADGVPSTTSHKLLIYGNPEKDSLALFSDSPSTLVVFKERKCTKRIYQTVSRKTFAEISDLSEDECKKISQKINYMEDQKSIYLENLEKHSEEYSPHKQQSIETPEKGASKLASETQKPSGIAPEYTDQKQKPTDKKPASTVTVTETASSSNMKPPVPVAEPVAQPTYNRPAGLFSHSSYGSEKYPFPAFNTKPKVTLTEVFPSASYYDPQSLFRRVAQQNA